MKISRPQTLLFAVAALGFLNPTQAKESQPTNLTELEQATLSIAESCRLATVGMTVGNAQGTGTIVTPDGLLITAFHCVGNVGREFEIILADGKRAKAITVYGHEELDVALVKILDEAPTGGWPYRPVRTTSDLQEGDWCVVFGNSAGIQLNRPAPMRLGRVLGSYDWQNHNQLLTDNTMVSGDSGGPLYDIEGQLAGVNSNVAKNSAFGNHHARISEVLKLWRETLNGKKELPSIDSLREQDLEHAKKRSAPKGLSEIHRKQTTELLKQQYGEDFPDEVIEIILASSTINPADGSVNIAITPEVFKDIIAAGHNPVKLGLVTAEQAKILGIDVDSIETPAKDNEHEKLIKEALLKQFKVEKISDEAMEILLKAAEFDKETGKLEVKLNSDSLAKLKEAGLDISSGDEKEPVQDKGNDEIVLKELSKQLEVELTEEMKKILLSICDFDGKTGSLNVSPDYETYEKLLEMGADLKKLGYIPTKLTNYAKLSLKFGDSAEDIAKSFPKTSPIIEVFSEGKQVALGTVIKSDGYFVSKASEINLDEKVGVKIDGVKMEAKFISQDEESDLALFKVDSRLEVPAWSKADLRLGNLLVSPAAGRPMLGLVSNLPYKIPAKVIGMGNGNSAILGIRAVSSSDGDNAGGVLIDSADKAFPAGKAGILKGDLITKWNGEPVNHMTELTAKVSEHSPGDKIEVTAERDGEILNFEVILESAAKSDLFALDSTSSTAQEISAASGKLSQRRRDLPECITHDALIWANDCGGPLYDSKGKVVGINIARYDRTASYALTKESCKAALKRLFAAE